MSTDSDSQNSSSSTTNHHSSSLNLTNLPTMHPIALKLDRNNYNFWKVQVLATARAYSFEDVLLQTEAPIEFLDDRITANPEYLTWLRRDQFLFSWILASITPQMMGYIGRCTTAAQIWKAFETLFHSQSKARAMKLRSQLQSTKKGASNIDDYILKFREISDQLFNIGQPISESDLVSYILQGLGAEFESISVLLSSRCDEMTLHEVQFALETHELRLQNQAAITISMANLTFQPQANAAYQSSNGSANNRGRGNGRYGRGSSNRGRGGRYSTGNKLICQLCGKTNHVALKCFKRFDVSFTGPDPPSSPAPQAHLTNPDTPSNSNSAYNTSSITTNSTSQFPPAAYTNTTHSTLPSTSEWYLDSGASAHVTADMGNMHTQTPYHGSESLSVGQHYSSGFTGGQT